MKKLVSIFVFGLLGLANAYSQYGFTNLKEVEGLKNRQLILVLMDEKSGEDGTLAKQVNEKLIKVFANNWTFSDQPQVKTAAEAEKIKEAENKNYAFVGVQHMKDQVSRTSSSTSTSVTYRGSNPNAGSSGSINKTISTNTTYNTDRKSVQIPALVLEFPGKTQFLYRFELPELWPTEGQLSLAVVNCQNYFSYWYTNKKEPELRNSWIENGPILATKTLLVNKADLDAKLTEEEITAQYPLPCQIVSSEFIEQALISKDPKYAIMMMICPPAYNQQIYNHNFYDCEKGKFLGYIGGVGNKVKAKHFKHYYRVATYKK